MSVDKWSIKDIDEAFYRHSGNLSVVLRQLIFAEGAVAWLLLTFNKINYISCLSFILYASLFLFIVFDLAHYWYLSNQYGELSEKMVNEQKVDVFRRNSKFKYQEFFFNAKKNVAVISILLFLLFVFNNIHVNW